MSAVQEGEREAQGLANGAATGMQVTTKQSPELLPRSNILQATGAPESLMNVSAWDCCDVSTDPSLQRPRA